MEPLSPLLWTVALSAQLSGGIIHPWSMVPGGTLSIQQRNAKFQWNQVGNRSSISVHWKNQNVQVGKWANGYWVNGAWEYKKGGGEFWYDVATRKWATHWTYAWNDRKIRIDTHPVWGARLGYIASQWQFELGNRWRIQWQPQTTAFRATFLGGWSGHSVYGAELQWKKMQLNYRVTREHGSQWRISLQPVQGVRLSLNTSKDRWRIQSDQRMQLTQKNTKSAVYLESSTMVHSRGIGWSIGAGKGIHRIYGASGFGRSQRFPWEVGWQTHGKWGKLGMYQIQFTAQKQANWSMQLRVSQGIQLGNGKPLGFSKSKTVPIQLECHVDGEHPRCQALLILKDMSTGNTFRYLVEGNAKRSERIPEGSYLLRVIGPEEWEFRVPSDRLTVVKGEQEKKILIYANQLVYKTMN